MEHNFDLTSFTKSLNGMVATNDKAYRGAWDDRLSRKIKSYSLSEIEKIIDSGDYVSQQLLSRNYFYKDGLYKQIILHYATLLKYMGILIPYSISGKNLSNSGIQKRYNAALSYIEQASLPVFLTNCAIRALVDGIYFGMKVNKTKEVFTIVDLPMGYCRSNYKDFSGNDVIEFDITYFNTISNEEKRKQALSIYPKVVQKEYAKYQRGQLKDKWVIIPTDIGICFTMFDGIPMFLNVIPATIKYDDAIETEREREKEEVRKILVQKVPHLTDGRLVFEPDEALEMHNGSVKMLKGNKNISVLTTYADVDAIVSRTAADTANNHIETMANNVYEQAGVSGQLFSSTGSTTLETSIKNDLSLMMYLANKFSIFITSMINELYSNKQVIFKYQILPITYHNEDRYIENSFKLASSGYSFLLPALAMGMNQRDLPNIKQLENDILKLGDKLIPLASSYTQSAADNKNGAPKKEQDEKAEQTIENEKSLDNQTGD